MRLVFILFFSLILFSSDILCRPPRFRIFNYPVKRASDTSVFINQEWCAKLIQDVTEILFDPDIDLTPEQQLMIPKVNEKKLIKHQQETNCPEEYNSWFSNLQRLDYVLTDKQRMKIFVKMRQFLEIFEL